MIIEGQELGSHTVSGNGGIKFQMNIRKGKNLLLKAG
jgi:hypothetical protein